VQNPAHKELKMAELVGQTQFDFLGQTRKAFILSLIAIVVGGALFVEQRKTLFGMDFTGGYSLRVDLQEKQGDPNYRREVTDALLDAGGRLVESRFTHPTHEEDVSDV